MADDELKQDVKEIKADVKSLLQTSAVHNHLLKEHERRSLALEQAVKIQEKDLNMRLAPIEQHVSWINAMLKIAGMILVGLVVQFIIRRLL